MNHGWENKKLGEVCSYQRGLTYSKEDESELSDNIVLRANNIDLASNSLVLDEFKYLHPSFEISSKYKLVKDSILICMSSGSKQHLGKVAFIDSDMDLAFGGFMGLIKPIINAKFLFLYLTSNAFRKHLFRLTNGININNLKFSTLQDIALPVPNENIQQEIVAELDKINEIIEANRALLGELDSLAQSLFYDTFGDPITNPKGWQIYHFGDLATSINYGTSSPSKEGGRYVYLRMNNLTDNGYLDYSDLKYIDVSEEDFVKYSVEKGDILFNRTNSREKVGKTALFQEEHPMIIAGYIIRVRVNKELLNPVFAVRLMNMPETKGYLRKICRGAVNQVNINSKEMAAIPFLLPPLELQKQFASQVEAIERQKADIEATIAELQTLLDSRMDYWFND